jgi:hypothetical protein
MSQIIELPGLNLNAAQALPLITNLLSGLGFHVIPSFDLQAACLSHSYCKCPHHETNQCDCQFVVLLIYGQDGYPVSVVVHGQDGRSYLSLVDSPQQRSYKGMLDRIRRALIENFYPAR